MVHTYKIDGMSCNGCRSRIENALNKLPEVSKAMVSLDPPEAVITMKKHIADTEFQQALSALGDYKISMKPIHPSATAKASCCFSDNKGEQSSTSEHKNGDVYYCPMKCEGEKEYHESGRCPVCGMYLIKKESNAEEAKDVDHHHHHHAISETHQGSPQAGTYYCPMFCEGDKTYDKPGSCPVCGMHLVKAVEAVTQTATKYTCPMHPEIVRDGPGFCPICGMDLVPVVPNEEVDEVYIDLRRKFITALVLTIPVFILSMAPMLRHGLFDGIISGKSSNWVQFFLTLPVVFYCGWMFFQKAWLSFKTRNLNMFSLIGVGTAAAFLFSVIGLFFPDVFPASFKSHDGSMHLYFEAVVVILTLVLLGQLMEARAHAQTGKAIKSLLQLAPVEAILVEHGMEKKVPLGHIKKGDILRVKPGDKIPVDGVITEGGSTVDESMISGEPIPVEKNTNDKVSSGTINNNGSFLMKAERVGHETLLAQIIEMVNSASRSRAPIQKLADKISKWFVPTVILIAVFTFVSWSFLGGEQRYVYALVNAVAVLIVACPCALGLATPMSVMVGVGKGAQYGVLIKNAEALETMNKVDVLITDKTGTLTEGKPSVESIVSAGALSDRELLQLAASVNIFSEHPLASAIVEKAKTDGLGLLSAENFEAISGKGAIAIIDGKRIAIGNAGLMELEHAIIPEILLGKVAAQINTISYIAIDGRVEGFISIADKVKPSAKHSIQTLHKMGIDVIMITGDNRNTAKVVANELGIKQYHAQALPSDKLDMIKQLQAEGKIVAMAGDGINDAPALAQSNVGIAMGTGTDVAIESAGITLLSGDLSGIVRAKSLSQKVMKNIKQNLFFAFIYNALGVPIAAGVLYQVFGILMSPMIAAAAMSFSSVSVILNALRLRAAKI